VEVGGLEVGDQIGFSVHLNQFWHVVSLGTRKLGGMGRGRKLAFLFLAGPAGHAPLRADFALGLDRM